MRENPYKAITIITILGSFAIILMLHNAIALRPAKQPYTAFQTFISGKTQRPPVYIMTGLTKTADLTITVEGESYGTVAKKKSKVDAGRTAIKIPWKAIDKKGYILPELYNIKI